MASLHLSRDLRTTADMRLFTVRGRNFLISKQNLIIWASVFVVAFLVSLLLFFTKPGRTDRYVLFFPSETTDEWIGEAREIRHTRNSEKALLAMLKELALGPMTLRFEPAVPKGTGVRSVLLRDRKAYLDFSAHLAAPEKSFGIPFEEMLMGIEKSVFFNFPAVEEVIIYVAGMSAIQ